MDKMVFTRSMSKRNKSKIDRGILTLPPQKFPIGPSPRKTYLKLYVPSMVYEDGWYLTWQGTVYLVNENDYIEIHDIPPYDLQRYNLSQFEIRNDIIKLWMV